MLVERKKIIPANETASTAWTVDFKRMTESQQKLEEYSLDSNAIPRLESLQN